MSLGSIAIGFVAGAAVAALLLVLRQRRHETAIPLDTAEVLRVVHDPLQHEKPLTAVHGQDPAPPHLISLLAQAIREPLRMLRRVEGCPPEVLERLERVAWQSRMLVARPRPMQGQPTSAISLLQEAAEEVAQLRDGTVGASWSLLNRQPVHVDPERMRAAFRELLASGAEKAGPKGRLGIKILPGDSNGYPVRIEIEIGRRGTEPDPLATLVSRHLIESEGGRLEVDGNVTRILLRTSAPVLSSSVA